MLEEDNRMETMEDCPFCGIAEGNVPAHVVYQDSHSVAFTDKHPNTHAHIVPMHDYHDITSC